MANYFPSWLPFCIPNSNGWKITLLSYVCQHLVFATPFILAVLMYIAIPHDSLNLGFPNSWCWMSLHLLVCCPLIPISEMSPHVLCTFSKWICFYIAKLWELLYIPDMCHLVACLFIILPGFFTEPISNFNEVQLSI